MRNQRDDTQADKTGMIISLLRGTGRGGGGPCQGGRDAADCRGAGRAVRRCLCLVCPLPLQLRHRLCLVFPLPSWAETPPPFATPRAVAVLVGVYIVRPRQ